MAGTQGTALVTGASAGIGVAYAELLAQKGYDLVLVARRGDRLEALAKKLSSGGAKAEPLVADLTKEADLARVEQRIASDATMSLVINNAGFGGYKPFAELELSTLSELIGIHITAVARLTRAALPGMLQRNRGGIINVASLLALSGTIAAPYMPKRAMYAGAKAFMLAFSQTVANEVAGTNVKVQCCLPGVVATEFHTVQGFKPTAMPAMKPEDLAAASLVGLERGEVVCAPGVEDAGLLENVWGAQRAVFGGAKPEVATRYRK